MYLKKEQVSRALRFGNSNSGYHLLLTYELSSRQLGRVFAHLSGENNFGGGGGAGNSLV